MKSIKSIFRDLPTLGGLLMIACTALLQGSPTQTTHQDSAHESRMHRGEKGMGFSQTTATHHFLLKRDGGVIAVSANDKKDTATRDQIRMHLSHIADAFAEGDFDVPMLVHDELPPGAAVMKRLSREIEYQFRPTEGGGEVVVSSKFTEAVHAIHDFLAYQIREHQTGDPISVP